MIDDPTDGVTSVCRSPSLATVLAQAGVLPEGGNVRMVIRCEDVLPTTPSIACHISISVARLPVIPEVPQQARR